MMVAMAVEYYYKQNDKRHGPFAMAKLQELAAAGTVQPTDLVWRQGLPDWIPAGQVKELFPETPSRLAPRPEEPHPAAAVDHPIISRNEEPGPAPLRET